MIAEEHIVEQIKKAEMAREGKYEEYMFPKEVLKITRNDEGRIIETAKQPEIRKVATIPPKPVLEAGRRKNGKKIVKVSGNRGELKMKNAARRVTEMHTTVPIIYYIVMIFGLASAIFGAIKVISPTIDFTIMLGGLGIFLAAFIGFLEIKLSKNEFREI